MEMSRKLRDGRERSPGCTKGEKERGKKKKEGLSG